MTRILLLVGFLAQISLAQQTELDLLLEALKNHPAEDTARLTILNELAYKQYPYVDPDQGLERADKAIALAQKLSRQTQLAYAYRSKGINYWAQAEYASALEMYSLALKTYEAAQDEEGKADTYNNIGVIYLSLADYPKALDYYLKALPVYEQSANKKVANILTNIGIIHKNLSNPSKALEYYKRALPLYEVSDNLRGTANVLGNIGNAYDDMDSTAQALEYDRKALRINEILGNKKGIANNLNSLGIIYSGVSDFPKALECLQNSLHLYEQLGEKNSISFTLVELGKIYRKAPESFLIERGIAPSTRYAKALAFQKNALQLATEIGSLDRQAFAWEELSSLYEEQEAYPKAFAAFRKAVALRDSIVNDKSKSEIAAKTMQFEFDKKEASLKAEHDKREALGAEKLNQQRIQNNSVMGGVALLFLTGVSSFLFYKKRRDADEQRKEAEFKVQVTDTEMKAFRSQMNPHFIFNSLNSISDFILKHDIETADYYLTKFAKLMRMILDNSEQKEVSLADDLRALEFYLQLESLRLNHKFRYEIQVDEAIDREATLIPPLLLQPFVENSIWHGIAMKQGEGMILIRITQEDEMITCIVEDNGVGRKRAALLAAEPDKRSLGMKIAKARIDIINRMKQSEATMKLFDLSEGTRVEVKLPLVLSY